MKLLSLSLVPALLLAACAGDNHVTTQSAREPARFAGGATAGAEVNRPARNGKYVAGRIYLVTRLETADQKRGEWRTQGATIREHGSEIEFVEMGSGKTVSFTAPHQITPMDSRMDRGETQPAGETPTDAPSARLFP